MDTVWSGRRLLAAGALALVLTGCGDGDAERADDTTGASPSASSSSDDTASPTRKTPDTSDWPECEDTWIAKKRLPSGYRGCVDGSNPVRAKKTWCESGQVIVTYADRFYAVLGGVVNETGGLRKSPVYKRAVRACLG